MEQTSSIEITSQNASGKQKKSSNANSNESKNAANGRPQTKNSSSAIVATCMTANSLPFAGHNDETNITIKEFDDVTTERAEMLRKLEAAIEAVGGF